MGRGQAKAEAGPGPRAGDEGSDLRQPEGGQAMTRLSTGTSLGLARGPDNTPGEGVLGNQPGTTSTSLAKTTTPNQRVMNSHPGALHCTGKSKCRKETLSGQDKTIPPPTTAMVDLPSPDEGSPHCTVASDTKKSPKVDVMSGVRSDQTDLSTDITDNNIYTNQLSTIYYPPPPNSTCIKKSLRRPEVSDTVQNPELEEESKA